jgi:formate hydrogenlyase subunit 6/NADH:ubiquinone oxidoreductase subunit I
MAYHIGEECTGCGLCARKCPESCITGNKKERHIIDDDACIDCGVCASYCPVACIKDSYGQVTVNLKPKERPIAVVDDDFCSGCEFCVGLCPFNCIEMFDSDSTERAFPLAKVVRPKDCVACRQCEDVCEKDAIIVRWPDGSSCENLNKRNTSKNGE